jgi:glyoxylase-like metal-dependent hydrolase (beta-lactamase superfamily II)
MQTLSQGLRFADVRFRGVPGVIATAVLEGPGGIALVDPGPTSCLPALEAALADGGRGLDEVEAVLLTHIHLDHAGAAGTIVARHPGVRVFVHERGAKHMIDPRRLIESATMLYGDQMDTLWGAFEAVPASAVQILQGGEVLEVAGRTLDVAYTPGHAQHHVAYFDRASRLAFVGDVGGGRTAGMSTVMPPTPPPDIDLDAWRASVARILAWQPEGLFLTHFGLHQPAGPHLATMLDRLERLADLARQLLHDPGVPEADRETRFRDDARRFLRRELSDDDLRRLELAVPLEMCWRGLERYWSKKGRTEELKN